MRPLLSQFPSFSYWEEQNLSLTHEIISKHRLVIMSGSVESLHTAKHIYPQCHVPSTTSRYIHIIIRLGNWRWKGIEFWLLHLLARIFLPFLHQWRRGRQHKGCHSWDKNVIWYITKPCIEWNELWWRIRSACVRMCAIFVLN